MNIKKILLWLGFIALCVLLIVFSPYDKHSMNIFLLICTVFMLGYMLGFKGGIATSFCAIYSEEKSEPKDTKFAFEPMKSFFYIALLWAVTLLIMSIRKQSSDVTQYISGILLALYVLFGPDRILPYTRLISIAHIEEPERRKEYYNRFKDKTPFL